MLKVISGRIGGKMLAAFLAAAVMIAALFLVLPGKVYGDTNNELYHVNLLWDFDYVIVNEPGPAGQEYLVEYGEDGKPFYRYGDTEIAVEQSKVISKQLSLSLDVDLAWVTTGHEFDEQFNPATRLGQEIAGWSTKPGGDITHLNYFRFSQIELSNGLTLYPVLKPIPNVTYHNTITGEVFVSPGGTGDYWEPTHEEPYPPEDFHPDYTLYAQDEIFTAPYRILAGWAEEPGGELKYHFDDKIVHKEHLDLYSVWRQSRISDIPPAILHSQNDIEHFWFGGKYWRKLGASDEKALLVYDDEMAVGWGMIDHARSDQLFMLVKQYCTDWYNGFANAEQAAVCSTDKEEEDIFPPLDKAKLFLLSWREAQTYFSGNEDRKIHGQFTDKWFLRVDYPASYFEGFMLPVVDENGHYLYGIPLEGLDTYHYYQDYGLNFSAGERPAFVLDLSKVLFTSSAEQSNKSFEPTDGSSFGFLNDPYEHWQRQQKLTLLDETYKDFTASVGDRNRAVVAPGDTVEVKFVNAVTDTGTVTNRYVSAMLCEKDGGVVGYASMKPAASSGTWELKLPSDLDLAKKDYILKVFNEEQNGVACSDFASPFSEIILTKDELPYVKSDALEELAEIEKTIDSVYSGAEKTAVQNAIDQARQDIEAAQTIDEVNNVLETATVTISKQKTNAKKKEEADAANKAKAEALAKASNINKATVTASDIRKASNLGATTVTLGPKVKKIKAKAFKGTKITTVVVKTKKLKAKAVKNCFKSSKVKTVKVKVGTAKVNKKYKKIYKKVFAKKNAGKKVGVK